MDEFSPVPPHHEIHSPEDIIDETLSRLGLEFKAADLSEEHRQIFHQARLDTLSPIEADQLCKQITDSLKQHDIHIHLRRRRPRYLDYSPRSEQTVGLVNLYLHQLESSELTENEKARTIDTAFLILHLSAGTAFLEADSADLILSTMLLLREYGLKHTEGLSPTVRQELLIQSAQLAACQILNITTTIYHENDEFSGKEGRLLEYPQGQLDSLTADIASKTETEKLLLICALTSPYKTSLGNSPQGHANLEQLKASCQKAVEIVSTLPVDSETRSFAEETVLISLFHTYEGQIPGLLFRDFTSDSLTWFKEYQEYRKDHPLWKDRLAIYKTYPDQQVLSSYETAKSSLTEADFQKNRVGFSTTEFQALKIIENGSYLSLYEALAGNGTTTVSVRASHEHRMFLLASGFPDDPYPRYGAVRLIDPKGFGTLHYGSVTFMLSQSDDLTFTLGDSFNWNTFPVNDTRIGAIMENQRNKDNWVTSYTEAQKHGGLNVDDFEAIVVEEPSSFNSDLIEKIVKECQEKYPHIKIVYKNNLGSYPQILAAKTPPATAEKSAPKKGIGGLFRLGKR